MDPQTPHLVYITCAHRDQAATIARHLVEHRLAACANLLGPVESWYWWDGRIQEDREVVLLAKTVAGRLEDLTAAVISLHTYACPCVVALPISVGHAPYLAWLRSQVHP